MLRWHVLQAVYNLSLSLVCLQQKRCGCMERFLCGFMPSLSAGDARHGPPLICWNISFSPNVQSVGYDVEGWRHAAGGQTIFIWSYVGIFPPSNALPGDVAADAARLFHLC
jgi:hypothetical protein